MSTNYASRYRSTEPTNSLRSSEFGRASLPSSTVVIDPAKHHAHHAGPPHAGAGGNKQRGPAGERALCQEDDSHLQCDGRAGRSQPTFPSKRAYRHPWCLVAAPPPTPTVSTICYLRNIFPESAFSGLRPCQEGVRACTAVQLTVRVPCKLLVPPVGPAPFPPM